MAPFPGTNCELELNAENPFDLGLNDTRAYCEIKLAAVGATSAVLLNTCSYPSQQPNSDPSDCVLVPGQANPTASTAPYVIPNDTTTISNWASGGTGGTLTFYLYARNDCSATPVWTSTAKTVTGNTTYDSGNDGGTSGYRITTANDSVSYFWKVVYSGDAKNNGFTSTCGGTGDEQVAVTITP